MDNGKGFEFCKTGIYVYDIPKKYGSSEVEAILKEFGKVSSYETKRLHKYQLIKAEIFMSKHWLEERKKKPAPYITVSVREEILNLRFVYATIKRAEVEESWKRTTIIKTPGYNGKRNDLKAISEYLSFCGMYVPFVFGKSIIIQGKLYFWAIFKNDDRVRQAVRISQGETVAERWEILSDSKIIKKKKEQKSLLSTVPNKEEKEKKNKRTGG
jgi:hypothetical protein